MTFGWMTLNSRCGSVSLPISEIKLRGGRISFVGSVTLVEDHVTDEWSRVIVFGHDGVQIGDFPYGNGDKLDYPASVILTVTMPIAITSVR